jgi:tetratricopeptide (TPR) repeat protein
MIERAVAISRSMDDRWVLADALSALGNVAARDQPDRALEAELESLEIFRELEDRLQTAHSLYLLGALGQDGNLDHAASWLEESLQLSREAGSPSGEGHALLHLGSVRKSLGDDHAYETLTEALRVLTEVGDRHCAANSEREMALMELSHDPDVAKKSLRRALTTGTSVRDHANMALTLEAIGKLMAQGGKYEPAVKLYAAAVPLLRESGQAHTSTTLADREPEFSLAKEQLDETSYQKAWDEGAAMTEDEAVEFALERIPV